MLADEHVLASLRVIGGIVDMLSSYADRVEQGEPVAAPVLRRLAERLGDEHARLWERLVTPPQQ